MNIGAVHVRMLIWWARCDMMKERRRIQAMTRTFRCRAGQFRRRICAEVGHQAGMWHRQQAESHARTMGRGPYCLQRRGTAPAFIDMSQRHMTDVHVGAVTAHAVLS